MSSRLNEDFRAISVILKALCNLDYARWSYLHRYAVKEVISPSTFNRVLSWLIDKGFVKHYARGYYKITSKGKLLFQTLGGDHNK